MPHAVLPAEPVPAAAPDAEQRLLDRLAAGRGFLRSCLLTQLPLVTGATVAAVVRQLAMLSVPYLLQRGIDDGIVAGDPAVALRWAAAIVVAVVVQAAGMSGWDLGIAIAAARIAAQLRMLLTRALLSGAGLERFERDGPAKDALAEAPGTDGPEEDGSARDGPGEEGPHADGPGHSPGEGRGASGHGDLAMRATRDVTLVRTWVLGLPALAVIATTLAVVLPGTAALDPALLVVALAMIPLLVVVNLAFPRRFERAGEALAEAHGERADVVDDLIGGAATLRGVGADGTLLERHHRHSAAVTERTIRASRVMADWMAAGMGVPRLALAAGVALGGVAIADGRLTPGQLVAFTSWMLTLTLAIEVLVARLIDRGQAGVAAARIRQVLVAAPRVDAPARPVPLPAGGVLHAERVSAEIGGRRVLGPVELTVAPGELVVVDGPTGAGRSTLLRVLARHIDPAGGGVRLGGVDLRDSDPEDVRAHIALVPQRPALFAGTVGDNLLLGRAADPRRVRSACEAAAADEIIDGLPDGLGTVVGEGGSTLSGGQVQRLALARALLRETGVLLLDDVTSALDPATERRVLAGVRAYAPDAAIVLVSHRPAARQAADRVITLRPPSLTGAGQVPGQVREEAVWTP